MPQSKKSLGQLLHRMAILGHGAEARFQVAQRGHQSLGRTLILQGHILFQLLPLTQRAQLLLTLL